MTPTPVRLRLSSRKGFDLQAHSLATNGLPAVNVARPGRLGNPFVVGVDGSRFECVGLYVLMLNGMFSLRPDCTVLHNARANALGFMPKLRGFNIACKCALPKPGRHDVCHAAILLSIANRTDDKPYSSPLLDHLFPKPVVGFRDASTEGSV